MLSSTTDLSDKVVRAPSCGHGFHPQTACIHTKTQAWKPLSLKEFQSDDCGCNKLDHISLKLHCVIIYTSKITPLCTNKEPHIHNNTETWIYTMLWSLTVMSSIYFISSNTFLGIWKTNNTMQGTKYNARNHILTLWCKECNTKVVIKYFCTSCKNV